MCETFSILEGNPECGEVEGRRTAAIVLSWGAVKTRLEGMGSYLQVCKELGSSFDYAQDDSVGRWRTAVRCENGN
jgi:hypothetical protein